MDRVGVSEFELACYEQWIARGRECLTSIAKLRFARKYGEFVSGAIRTVRQIRIKLGFWNDVEIGFLSKIKRFCNSNFNTCGLQPFSFLRNVNHALSEHGFAQRKCYWEASGLFCSDGKCPTALIECDDCSGEHG